MSDDPIEDFDASAEDIVTMRVNGRDYEFRSEDIPALKERFTAIEVSDGE